MHQLIVAVWSCYRVSRLFHLFHSQKFLQQAAADESNMFSLLSHTSKYSQQRSCVLTFHFHVSALQMWFIFRLKATAGVTLNTVHRKKAHSKYEARGLEHIYWLNWEIQPVRCSLLKSLKWSIKTIVWLVCSPHTFSLSAPQHSDKCDFLDYLIFIINSFCSVVFICSFAFTYIPISSSMASTLSSHLSSIILR